MSCTLLKLKLFFCGILQPKLVQLLKVKLTLPASVKLLFCFPVCAAEIHQLADWVSFCWMLMSDLSTRGPRCISHLISSFYSSVRVLAAVENAVFTLINDTDVLDVFVSVSIYRKRAVMLQQHWSGVYHNNNNTTYVIQEMQLNVLYIKRKIFVLVTKVYLIFIKISSI